MLLATFWKERRTFIAGVAVSLVVTYALCNLAVQQKWQTRLEMAKTEKQLEAATADGANIVFTAYVSGPLEAILCTLIWGYIGRKAWPILQKQELKNET